MTLLGLSFRCSALLVVSSLLTYPTSQRRPQPSTPPSFPDRLSANQLWQWQHPHDLLFIPRLGPATRTPSQVDWFPGRFEAGPYCRAPGLLCRPQPATRALPTNATDPRRDRSHRDRWCHSFQLKFEDKGWWAFAGCTRERRRMLICTMNDVVTPRDRKRRLGYDWKTDTESSSLKWHSTT